MRELTSHQINDCNKALTIRVCDEPGAGGASSRYKIDGPTRTIGGESAPLFQVDMRFQNGPIAEGVNGITHECLLAILIDRLEGFQSGQFACEENAEALDGLKHARDILHFRTEKRQLAGIEGTHQK